MRAKVGAMRLAAALVLCATQIANANPTAIGLGDFSGSETIIGFSSLLDTELITSQYSGLGATFGGALYGMTSSYDLDKFPNNGDGVIASNWIYGGPGRQGAWFDVHFDSVMHRVGFDLETWEQDDTTIEIEYFGTSSGSLTFSSVSIASEFVAVEDIDGFDHIRVSVETNDNGFYAIDNFSFEAIPEPASIGLLGLVSGGIYFSRRFFAV